MGSGRLTVVLASAVGGAGWLAHALHYRFLQDDAFIFLRYASHVAGGNGPVWNPGERVEGYSSPAWLVAATLVELGPLPPELGLHVATLALGAITLALAFALASGLGGSVWAGAVAVALLAADRTFAVWSTSGMETRLFGASVLALSLLTWRRITDRKTRGATGQLACALLLCSFARPEGLMMAGLTLGFLLLRRSRGAANDPRATLTAAGLWAGGVGLHVAWRWLYYDRLLPNTFYAKVSGFDVAGGVAYLSDFALSYPALCLAATGAWGFQLSREVGERTAGLTSYLAAVGLAYGAYLVAIGGDFMEFRMLDVGIVHASVVVAATLCSAAAERGGRVRTAVVPTLVAVLLLAALYAGHRFERVRHTVMPRSWMWELSTREWVVVGQWLGRMANPDESVATTAAGAIPYYSGLTAIDMLGLSDRHVADGPARPGGGGAGHRKLASDDYLAERGVTYVVGHPMLYDRPDPSRLEPGGFFVRVSNHDPEVRNGRDFHLALRTTGDVATLVRSLRARGVVVAP